MHAPASPLPEAAVRPGVRVTQERILAVLLVVEIGVFCVIGKNFLSTENAFEVVRLAVEIGLLALALTPVIVAGGIDLSVGSLMGLSAVLFGMLIYVTVLRGRRQRRKRAAPAPAVSVL